MQLCYVIMLRVEMLNIAKMSIVWVCFKLSFVMLCVILFSGAYLTANMLNLILLRNVMLIIIMFGVRYADDI